MSLDGEQRVYLSWEAPKCHTGCADNWLGDGYCDRACNVSRCGFDLGDCANKTEDSEDMGQRRRRGCQAPGAPEGLAGREGG